MEGARCVSPRQALGGPLSQHPRTLGISLDDGYRHVLVAATGGTSVSKLRSIVSALSHHEDVRVAIILTATAISMVGPRPCNGVPTFLDADEWSLWGGRGDPVLHIELRRWAHVLVVAPLTANTLAKVSMGLCDNLLTCVVRAWDPLRPLILAPCMQASAYSHRTTARHLRTIATEMPWVQVLRPSEKVAAAGEIGLGGMVHWEEVVQRVEDELGLEEDDSEEE